MVKVTEKYETHRKLFPFQRSTTNVYFCVWNYSIQSVAQSTRVTYTRTQTYACNKYFFLKLDFIWICEKNSTIRVYAHQHFIRIWSITASKKNHLYAPQKSITLKIYWARKKKQHSWNITWKKSSVETPNHSGESKNWCWNTMCRALWFCDTTSLHVFQF